MSLYKTRPFARIAKKAGIVDAALKASAEEMRAGIIHANLGGNVYKQRLAAQGGAREGEAALLWRPTCKTDGYLSTATSKKIRMILRLMN